MKVCFDFTKNVLLARVTFGFHRLCRLLDQLEAILAAAASRLELQQIAAERRQDKALRQKRNKRAQTYRVAVVARALRRLRHVDEHAALGREVHRAHERQAILASQRVRHDAANATLGVAAAVQTHIYIYIYALCVATRVT